MKKEKSNTPYARTTDNIRENVSACAVAVSDHTEIPEVAALRLGPADRKYRTCSVARHYPHQREPLQTTLVVRGIGRPRHLADTSAARQRLEVFEHPAVRVCGGGGGGGGGTGSASNDNGAAGGDGRVTVRYHIDGSDGVSTSSTGGTITTSAPYTIHTFTTSGTFTVVLASAAATPDAGIIWFDE